MAAKLGFTPSPCADGINREIAYIKRVLVTPEVALVLYDGDTCGPFSSGDKGGKVFKFPYGVLSPLVAFKQVNRLQNVRLLCHPDDVFSGHDFCSFKHSAHFHSLVIL